MAFSASAFLAAASAAFLASALAFSALAASAAALFSAALAACSAFALAAASALSSPALRAASSFRAAASAASAALAALIAATLEPASSEAMAVGLASAVWVVAPEEDLAASTLTTFTAVCAMTFLTAGSTPRATGADAGAWYAGGATFEPVFAFITEAGSKPRSSLYSAVCATWLPWKDARASADGAAAESSIADAMAPATGTGGRVVGCVGQPRRRRARPSLVFSRDGSITTRLRRYPKQLGAGAGEKRGREARDEAGCNRGGRDGAARIAARHHPSRRVPREVAAPGSGFGVSVFFWHTHRPRRMRSCWPRFRRRWRPARGRRRGRRARG